MNLKQLIFKKGLFVLGAAQIQNQNNLDVLAVSFPGCISVVIQVRNLGEWEEGMIVRGIFMVLKMHCIAVLFLLMLLTFFIQNLL